MGLPPFRLCLVLLFTCSVIDNKIRTKLKQENGLCASGYDGYSSMGDFRYPMGVQFTLSVFIFSKIICILR